MEKYLATITVYKNTKMLFTSKILTQWISTVSAPYIDIDNSPYMVVLEINGNVVILDPKTEEQAREINFNKTF